MTESSRRGCRVQHVLPIIGLATAHTPRVAADVALNAGAAHDATAEEHVKRVGGIAHRRCRRPVGGRLHIQERMARGKGRITVARIHQGGELLP